MSKINRQGKQQVPKIRFDGFSGDWEQRTIASLSETTIGGGTPSTVIEKYWQGEIPWIQSSDLHIDNVLDISPTKKITENAIENSAARLIPKNSLAIVTRVGVGKLCFLPYEYATSQDFLSLVGLNINHLYATYSLYRFLQEEKNKVQGTAIKGLTKADLLSQKISVSPSIEEQTQIGNFFQQLDKLIELQTRAVESAETYKKAMLQKMFPQKGEKVPRVRFEGFSGDWEERKVGDIFTATRGQVLAATKVSPIKVDSYQYPVYSSQTKDNGLLGYYDSFLFENAITWTTDGANAGTVNYRKEKFYSTNVNGVLLSDAGFANPTISEILNSVAFKYVSRVGNPKLMNNIMVEIPIIVPPLLEEQIMIGNYIQKLDQNIESEKQKLEQYQTMKRALLQRMFV